MRLAIRYGSDEGAIMKANNLITADLDFLPLQKVERRVKTASDGSTSEIDVVVRPGTVLRIPVLIPGWEPYLHDGCNPARRPHGTAAGRRGWRLDGQHTGAEAEGTSKLAREEARYDLSENGWNIAEAFKALLKDEAWERGQSGVSMKSKFQVGMR
jgi:hypothetical protein